MKEKTMDVKEEQLVDFAVTARKYKTRLTAKYKQRKPWVSPSAYEIQSFIPGTVIKIDDSAIGKHKQLVIHTPKGSMAESYAKKKNIAYCNN